MKCKADMFPAKLKGYLSAEVFLSNKKPGIFESEKHSRVNCYICPQCGYVELQAEDPKGLKQN